MKSPQRNTISLRAPIIASQAQAGLGTALSVRAFPGDSPPPGRGCGLGVAGFRRWAPLRQAGPTRKTPRPRATRPGSRNVLAADGRAGAAGSTSAPPTDCVRSRATAAPKAQASGNAPPPPGSANPRRFVSRPASQTRQFPLLAKPQAGNRLGAPVAEKMVDQTRNQGHHPQHAKKHQGPGVTAIVRGQKVLGQRVHGGNSKPLAGRGSSAWRRAGGKESMRVSYLLAP